MMLMKREIEDNGFSDWQGDMIPGSRKETPGKCRAGYPTTVSALTLLFIRWFGFLGKLSFGEDGGWYEPIVFISDCCVTTIPKHRCLKIANFTCSQFYEPGTHIQISWLILLLHAALAGVSCTVALSRWPNRARNSRSFRIIDISVTSAPLVATWLTWASS